jgi:hypothetical protein
VLGDISVDPPTSFSSAVSTTVALFPENLPPKRLMKDLLFSGLDEAVPSFQLLFFPSSPSLLPQLLFCPLLFENDLLASLLPLIEFNCLLFFRLDNSFFVAGCLSSFLSVCSLVFPDFLFFLSSPASLLSFALPRDDLDLDSFDLFFLPLSFLLLRWCFLLSSTPVSLREVVVPEARGLDDDDRLFPSFEVDQRWAL